jgi:hypothetical protein
MSAVASIGKQPFQTFAGAPGTDDDLLLVLSSYFYLTTVQVARLLQKETSLTNIRKKLNAVVSNGFAEKVPIATKAGKPPDIFTLSVKGMKKLNDEKNLHIAIPKGERKHGYVEHTLAVNTLLINAALLPAYNQAFTVIDLLHERQLKAAPWKVPGGLLIPDGYVSYLLAGAPYGKTHEQVNIAFEIDRNSEEKEKIQGKVHSYCSYASAVCQSLTIAFFADTDKRAQQLRLWCEEYLWDNHLEDFANLFVFGLPPEDCEPDKLFTHDLFLAPFDTSRYALIEKMP